MVRIHGHSSAYTAYECLHQPTYSSVFNITNNYGCGGFCGGSPVKIGGFWNSFAYGMGNGLSGMFGGLGGMFGGGMGMFPWLNMFGMGNMFGGGMGMFPWLNMFGGGASSSKPATASTVTCSCGCNGSGKLDKDNPKIRKFSKDLDTNYKDKNKTLNQAEYDAELAKLKKLNKELDGTQDDDNKQWLKDLLNKLNGLAGEGVKTVDSIDGVINPKDDGEDEAPVVDESEVPTVNKITYTQADGTKQELKSISDFDLSQYTNDVTGTIALDLDSKIIIDGAFDAKLADLIYSKDGKITLDANGKITKIEFNGGNKGNISLTYNSDSLDNYTSSNSTLKGTNAYIMKSQSGQHQSYLLMAYVKDGKLHLVLDQPETYTPVPEHLGKPDQK